MKLLTLSLLCTALAVTARAEVRVWTTSDEDAKKFEGEFISASADSVAIKLKDGKKIVLPLSKLSASDKEFVVKQPAVKRPALPPKEGDTKPAEPETKSTAPATKPAEPETKPAEPETKPVEPKTKPAGPATKPAEPEEKAKESVTNPKDSEMGKALAGTTVKLEGKSLRKHDLFAAKSPEYFLVYWGSSSSKPCREAAPHLAELYDTKVTTAANVEFVHVSCDKGETKMRDFMRSMKFKFPAITMVKASKIKILNDMKPETIPACKLLDSSGKVIAEGDEAQQKAQELAAATEKAAGNH